MLPGAAVSLSSAQGTVGGSQETVSDARGAYQFLRLVPGPYSVKAQLQGFRTVEQRNIVVNADNTSRADLTLPIGGLEEGVVVSGEAPLLDTTSALKQTVLTQEVLQTLPNRMDMWSITRVIPSIVVSKVDVGGSESFQQSGAMVHGTSNESQYLVDGMDVSQTKSQRLPTSPHQFGTSPPVSSEITIETMRQALRKTGSGDLNGTRSPPLGSTSRWCRSASVRPLSARSAVYFRTVG